MCLPTQPCKGTFRLLFNFVVVSSCHLLPVSACFVQDVINIYLHNKPYRGFFLPCNFNLRIDSCCPDSEVLRPALLHGNALSFHEQRRPCSYGRQYFKVWSAFESIDNVFDKSPVDIASWPNCASSMNMSSVEWSIPGN